MTTSPTGAARSGQLRGDGLSHDRAGVARAVIPASIVALVPLVVLPGAFAPFHTGKWLVVAALVPAGLAVCAFSTGLRWPRWQWFLALVGVSLLSTLLGVAPWMSIAGSPNRNAGMLGLLVGIGAYVLGASVGSDPRVQRYVLRAAMLSGGVVGLLAVAEWLGVDLLGLGDLDEVSRARSTWGSATFAGAYFVMILPIAVAHLRSRERRWRAVAMLSTATMAAGLVLTGTRGAWLAAIVATAVMVPVWRSGAGSRSARDAVRSDDSLPAPRRTPSLGVIVGLGLVAAVVVALAAPSFARSSAGGRLDLVRIALPVIADRPLIGSGPDTQRVVLPSGIDESFEAEHGSEELHDRAHNLVLDTAVTTGLLGLAVLVALLVVLARDVVRCLRRELAPTAIAAGLLGYLVTLLFAFGDPTIDPIAWLLAGLLVVAISADAGSIREDRTERPIGADRQSARPTATPPGRITAKVLGAGFVLITVGAIWWAGREVVAEYHLTTALEQREAGDLSGALDSLESAASVAPARFDMDQIAARLVTRAITMGEPIASNGSSRGGSIDESVVQDAFRRLDRASRVAGDDSDLLMDRAELLTAAGRTEDAVHLYTRILELYPNSFRAHLGLGLAQKNLEQYDAAEASWERAAELAPGDERAYVNLGLLHEQLGEPDVAFEAFQRALAISPEDSVALGGVERLTAPEGE